MKSHFFAELLIETCMLREIRAVCIREIMQSLKESVKRLLEDKIEAFGVGDKFNVLNTHIEAPHGGIIIFVGMQNHTAQSIKSLEGYDIAWVEEAQSLSSTSLELLRPTIRKETCRHCLKIKGKEDVPCLEGFTHLWDPSEIWFSWNPDQPTDPVDKMLRQDRPPDSVVIKTGWEDNPWFPDVLRREMEWDRQVDSEKYEHVWGGEYEKHSEARVFKNWRVEAFEAPHNAVFNLGADWGFSVDPSTLVRCYEQRVDPLTGQAWARKRLYIDYDTYGVGVEIDDLNKLFDGLLCGCHPLAPGVCKEPRLHGWARPWNIVADSARPETISYLRRYGYANIEPAKKGANSVKEGVIFLQGYDIIIHPRCTHTIDEFKNYSYVKDKLTGKVIPVLEDKKNHIIDPIRYSVEQLRGALRIREAVWG